MLRIILHFSTAILLSFSVSYANPEVWKIEWPNTDFSKTNVDYSEIMSGGPPKDGIPSIDKPKFALVKNVKDLGDDEPVITFVVGNDARAYPLRILMWHEIANDIVGDIAVAVTYCPLCNAAIVFDRSIDGKVLEIGVSGKLRKSDMVMYDRQTQSWWQQYTGEAIVGKLLGKKLKMLPSRVESFSKFAQTYPSGKVLVPNNPNMRSYGMNPYSGYDSLDKPFLYKSEYKGTLKPMTYVVVVGNEAWTLDNLMKEKTINHNGLVLNWTKGQNSALDKRRIAQGRDIGNVTVQRDGKDVVYGVTFVFVFDAFHPTGTLYLK